MRRSRAAFGPGDPCSTFRESGYRRVSRCPRPGDQAEAGRFSQPGELHHALRLLAGRRQEDTERELVAVVTHRGLRLRAAGRLTAKCWGGTKGQDGMTTSGSS